MADERKAQEHERWMAMAPMYAKGVIAAGSIHNVHEMFISKLLPALKQNPAPLCLDIASASGEPAASIAQALPDSTVISTDFSEPFMELGKARAAALGINNISFDTADGENLVQFKDAIFDLVTCSLGLMFMPSHDTKALKEFKRVLKPGGLCAVTFWANFDRVPFMKVVMDFCKETDPSSVPNDAAPITACRLDPNEMKEAMAAAGFTSIDHTEFIVDVVYTREQQADWFARLLEMPFPIGKVIENAKAAGNENAYEDVKGKMEVVLKDKGYLTSQGLKVVGNVCHYIQAVSP